MGRFEIGENEIGKKGGGNVPSDYQGVLYVPYDKYGN
jgi:hypothetical protein